MNMHTCMSMFVFRLGERKPPENFIGRVRGTAGMKQSRVRYQGWALGSKVWYEVEQQVQQLRHLCRRFSIVMSV